VGSSRDSIGSSAELRGRRDVDTRPRAKAHSADGRAARRAELGLGANWGIASSGDASTAAAPHGGGDDHDPSHHHLHHLRPPHARSSKYTSSGRVVRPPSSRPATAHDTSEDPGRGDEAAPRPADTTVDSSAVRNSLKFIKSRAARRAAGSAQTSPSSTVSRRASRHHRYAPQGDDDDDDDDDHAAQGGGGGSGSYLRDFQRMTARRGEGDDDASVVSAASALTTFSAPAFLAQTKRERLRTKGPNETPSALSIATDAAGIAPTMPPRTPTGPRRHSEAPKTAPAKSTGLGDSLSSASASAAATPSKWKQQSDAFREAMRASRDFSRALETGAPLPPAVATAPDPSLIPCPHCGRRFNEKAGARHIPVCNSIQAKPKMLLKGTGGAGVAVRQKT
jgi:hypothetical protein